MQPIPDGVNEQDAAGLPETYFTVWSNVFFNQKIKNGSIFLVHGGSGGIGSTSNPNWREPWAYMFLRRQVQLIPCVPIGRSLGRNVRSISMKRTFVPILREIGGANIILDIIGGDYVARNIQSGAG